MNVAHLTRKGRQRSVRSKHLTIFCMTAGIAAIAIVILRAFLPKLPYEITGIIGGPIDFLFFILSGPAYLLGRVLSISIFTLAFEENELFVPLLLICMQWLIVWLTGTFLNLSERYWKVLLAVEATIYVCICILSFAVYLLLEFRM